MINKLMAGINELHNENQQKQAEVCVMLYFGVTRDMS